MILPKLLHLLSAVIWVGGMFFAYMVLRPAMVEILDPPQRLSLWNDVFRRFFKWVWLSIALLLSSGFYLIHLFGGMTEVAPHVHIMMLLGVAMIAIYSYLYLACYRPFSAQVAIQNWKGAGEILGRIRKLIAVNLTLGILTICVVVIGMAL